MSIGALEANAIDTRISSSAGVELQGESPESRIWHDPEALCAALTAKASEGRFKVSIGATTANLRSPYLLDEDKLAYLGTTDLASENHDRDTTDDKMEDKDIDLDAIVSALNQRRRVDAEHLSKVWRIDQETARRTLDVTCQKHQGSPNERLSRNIPTNDRMLRYKRIKDHFYMDTFFATKKAPKSTRKHTCCQLFVTDKGFVYVVPMKSKSEVLQAVKQFCKEIGAPEAIICDPAREQKADDLKQFLHQVGTSLRFLEEGTP